MAVEVVEELVAIVASGVVVDAAFASKVKVEIVKEAAVAVEVEVVEVVYFLVNRVLVVPARPEEYVPVVEVSIKRARFTGKWYDDVTAE